MKFSKYKKAYAVQEAMAELTPNELQCADYIAQKFREDKSIQYGDRGLFIWQTCQSFHVEDHHKVAKHLSQRGQLALTRTNGRYPK